MSPSKASGIGSSKVIEIFMYIYINLYIYKFIYINIYIAVYEDIYFFTAVHLIPKWLKLQVKC